VGARLVPRPAGLRPIASGALITANFATEYGRQVFAVLGKKESSIDAVIRKCGLPASATSVALFSLEMKRLIRQLPGKMFVRNQ
jgi:predicted Rossmann fold nucleotide-binding protein DprA/Smf involved in DNA uptake